MDLGRLTGATHATALVGGTRRRPEDVVEVFPKADFPWWIAGGYAIEFAVGARAWLANAINLIAPDPPWLRQLLPVNRT
ncbi:hypothetical protein GCM10009535_50410 [Streptomyces thermocarboxydovorans]|uniref:Uncharacterized protein n=1 Tax=Streptomyces thermocarboxydovorans TaxID=59298 RepID=A0ABN1HRS7_9ACTN